MFLLYFLMWIVFFGSVTVESVLFGLGIAVAIFAFTCAFMDHSLKKELHFYMKLGGMLRYVYVLICEIVKANLTVIHMILSEEEELKPTLVSFRSDLQTPMGRAFLANAITLTPGTITVSLESKENGNDRESGDHAEYVVHCLDESLAEGMDTSVCAQMIAELEQD
ncbi:MAG: Na+/H+ antiporter subunit E [Lachnospiraceae bacterium]|nr:Na+/H+ antiporter subunit E [Lachnospiraceae bacterium]